MEGSPHGTAVSLLDPAGQKYPSEHGPEHDTSFSSLAFPKRPPGHGAINPSPLQYTENPRLSNGAGHGTRSERVVNVPVVGHVES